MTVVVDESYEFRPNRLHGGLAVSASVVFHAAFACLVAWTSFGRPLPESLADVVVEVQVISAIEFESSNPSPAEVTPESRDVLIPLQTQPEDQALPGYTVATILRAGRVLADPGHAVFRKDLSELDPYERVTQLCNVEAAEQILLSIPGSRIDTVSASSFAETSLRGLVFEAPGAAFREERKWYHLSFACTVRGDFEAVTEFAFRLGDLIPESEWDAHNLIAEDLEDDD